MAWHCEQTFLWNGMTVLFLSSGINSLLLLGSVAFAWISKMELTKTRG
jgi:hypothetical protein